MYEERKARFKNAAKLCKNLSYMLQVDKNTHEMGEVEMPSLELKYEFVDPRINQM